MAETQPKLLQEYEDGIDVAAKYCNRVHEKKTKPDDEHGSGS